MQNVRNGDLVAVVDKMALQQGILPSDIVGKKASGKCWWKYVFSSSARCGKEWS